MRRERQLNTIIIPIPHTSVLYSPISHTPLSSINSPLNMNNHNNRYISNSINQRRISSSRSRYTGRDPPSFSSTLLDSIYRSFDDRQEPMAVKTAATCTDRSERRNRGARDRIVDCWMEEEFGDRRRSFPATSSSDSSSLGFSSSDADSFSGTKKNKSLKPIRTSSTPPPPRKSSESFSARSDGSSGGGGVRSAAKSRAMKFYGDLKRMKQPISPGGKLASFLNSLFTATGTAKKQRISTSNPVATAADRWVRATTTTTSTPTCSTASSYSRSCLSKTTSSSAAAAKRSVRFSPVSVVIDEEATAARSAMEKNRRVEEAAMEMLRNYNKKWEVKEAAVREEEDEEVESCCSSDLFELENLMEIGVDRYCAELPVYETTHVDTNRAIASGFMV